jgi:hypothetical protein
MKFYPAHPDTDQQNKNQSQGKAYTKEEGSQGALALAVIMEQEIETTEEGSKDKNNEKYNQRFRQNSPTCVSMSPRCAQKYSLHCSPRSGFEVFQ